MGMLSLCYRPLEDSDGIKSPSQKTEKRIDLFGGAAASSTANSTEIPLLKSPMALVRIDTRALVKTVVDSPQPIEEMGLLPRRQMIYGYLLESTRSLVERIARTEAKVFFHLLTFSP